MGHGINKIARLDSNAKWKKILTFSLSPKKLDALLGSPIVKNFRGKVIMAWTFRDSNNDEFLIYPAKKFKHGLLSMIEFLKVHEPVGFYVKQKIRNSSVFLNCIQEQILRSDEASE